MASNVIRHVILSAVFVPLPLSARAESTLESQFRAMVERPLFSASRRPPPVPLAPLDVPALPAPPPPAPNLSLSGVITGGGVGVALLRRPQDTAPIHVALGGAVDGWTVAEIRPRAIVLRRDARSVVVDLPTPGR